MIKSADISFVRSADLLMVRSAVVGIWRWDPTAVRLMYSIVSWLTLSGSDFTSNGSRNRYHHLLIDYLTVRIQDILVSVTLAFFIEKCRAESNLWWGLYGSIPVFLRYSIAIKGISRISQICHAMSKYFFITDNIA